MKKKGWIFLCLLHALLSHCLTTFNSRKDSNERPTKVRMCPKLAIEIKRMHPKLQPSTGAWTSSLNTPQMILFLQAKHHIFKFPD